MNKVTSIVVNNTYADIKEISDIEKQKQCWLGKDKNYVSSFDEVMCRLFDDNDFDSFVDKTSKEIGLSKEVITELIKLRFLLNSYLEKGTDEEIIQDIEWHKVSNQAKKVIELWVLKKI